MTRKTPTLAVATTAGIAALEFDGTISRLTKGQRAAALADMLAKISAALPLAYEIALASKDELVARVDREYDEIGPRLMELAQASDAAKVLVELIGSAEARLAVLAVVEGPEEAEGATQH